MKRSSFSAGAVSGAIAFLTFSAALAEPKRAPVPAVALPSSFAHAGADERTPPDEWWAQFEDPVLSGLIRQAFRHNRDVAAARARLVESRASIRSSQQDLLPAVTPRFGFTESTRSNNSPAIPRLSEANRPPGLPDLIPRRYGVFEAGFDASYELDLFGAQRSRVRAGRLDAAAQAEELHDTLLSLAAEVTRNYWSLRECQARLQLSGSRERSLNESLQLLAMRIGAGLASESERFPIESELASARAAVPPLAASLDQNVYALAALTGESRAELERLAADTRELPAAPRAIPAGLPSDLLQRRPDIRRATAQLHAATARRRTAETDWWPKFSLTSSVGGQSGEVANLLSAGSFFLNIAPRVSWGALQFQQTKANIGRQVAREQQQLALLEGAILGALRDVDTALSSVTHERKRLRDLEESLAIERRRTATAQALHRAGLTHYLGVLEAERRQIAASDQIVQSRGALARNLVSLYKALGGGWQSAQGAAHTSSIPNGEEK